MASPLEAEAIVIGAGPCGLFSVFQLGLVAIPCHVIDSGAAPGGQCAALYPDKPIYDIPAFTSLTGDELTARLMQQIKPFKAQFHYREVVSRVSQRDDRQFDVRTDAGLHIVAKVVVVATGGGVLPLKKPTMAHADLGLELDEGLIAVDTEKFESASRGLFAVGDVASYPGKLKLILSGFHEAALMAQEAFRIVNPGNRLGLQYTSSSSSLQKKLGAD